MAEISPELIAFLKDAQHTQLTIVTLLCHLAGEYSSPGPFSAFVLTMTVSFCFSWDKASVRVSGARSFGVGELIVEYFLKMELLDFSTKSCPPGRGFAL